MRRDSARRRFVECIASMDNKFISSPRMGFHTMEPRTSGQEGQVYQDEASRRHVQYSPILSKKFQMLSLIHITLKLRLRMSKASAAQYPCPYAKTGCQLVRFPLPATKWGIFPSDRSSCSRHLPSKRLSPSKTLGSLKRSRRANASCRSRWSS